MARLLYRIGGSAARHRFVALGVWLVIVVAAVGSVQVLGAKTNNSLTLPGTDSQAAFDLLAAKFPPQQNGSSPFVFQVDEGTLSDDRYKPAVDATFRAIKSSPQVYSVLNPVGKNAEVAGIISDDGKTGSMPVVLDVGTGFITTELADDVLAATEPARKAGIDVAVGGPIGSVLSTPDTATSERVGNISAMVILAIVFGSLIAMGLPIVSAAFGLAISVSVIGLLGHLVSVPTVAPTLATMVGLGVGIDYALFLMTKHLEQLDEGVEIRESIARSVASSGSAVVFAGSTVVIALASLAVAGIPLVTTLGFASAIAVFTAVCTSITLLPAILSLVGHGVQRLRLPSFLRMKPRPAGARRWDAWARWVVGHPWAALALSLAILLPLIVPLFQLELGQPDVGVTPTSTTQRQAYDMLTEGFGVGYNGPLVLALDLDPKATPSAAYTKKYDRATSLQRELEQEQQRLERQQAELERQQAALEAQQRELEREGAVLERQQASLERQAAALEAEQAALRSRAEALERSIRATARRIAPLAARLGFIEARERRIEQLIEQTTDPDRLRRLERRLAFLEQKEASVRGWLEPLVARERRLIQRGIGLARQAEDLRAEASALQREADALERQGARLQEQAAELRREGNDLRAQANELQTEADTAKAQERKAKQLQRELTTMLTQAGGDPRGTDPRIVAIQDGVGAVPEVVTVSPPLINARGDAVVMSAIPLRAPSSDATARLVTTLRDDTLPGLTSDDGVTAHVGGTTATNVDLARKISSRMAIVVATVLLLSFLLLMVAFRSLLVPVQAALTNLLSVGAALGVLTAVFQWGWGLSLIGLDAPRGTVPIASYVPLMMFAVLFGLSMDYEVFMVSRIAQHHAEGEDPRSAVTSGLGAAGHVVTAAALIMILVFASFILNGDPTIKQFGVGLSVAVLLAGAMVVLLAPALLALFGQAMFRLPSLLGRILPRIDVEGGIEPDEGAEPSSVPGVAPAPGGR
jgi:uncharacterized membrane protein YdfJ with MMPL/SSD domain